jgi:hypothetical protein
MNRHDRSLRTAADKYLTEARDAGLGADVGPIRGPVSDIFNALEAFEAARATVLGDPHLSDDGRRARLAPIEATARQAATSAAATARRRLDATRQQLEAKVQLPRVPDADLMGARHDLDRLTANVRPGELADRLAFAARNGGDSVADLLLRDNYSERVILPSLGADYAGDAAQWAGHKRALIRERLGPASEPHMKALDAVPTASKAVTIGDFAVQQTFGRSAGEGA